MSETNLSDKIKKLVKDEVYWDRIECISRAGVPDVFYSFKRSGPYGAIELKKIDDFPKRSKFMILKHLTDDQILWMATRGASIKRAFMLLKVGDTFNLIKWHNVFRFKKFTKEDLIKYSYRRWIGNIEKNSFLEALRNGG